MKFDNLSYRQIIENLHDGLYFVDRDRRITYWNKAAEIISGYSAAEVVGNFCSDNILTHVDAEGNSLCLDKCPLAYCMEDGKPREATVYMHHRDGHRIPVSVRTSALRDENGEIIGGVELFTDVSTQEANELRVKELEKLALLDILTQLANRTYMEREIQTCIDENRRHQVPFGVIFIDIDHFKKFNDKYGHDVGDGVLKCVAKTMVTNSRPFDLYGRWGGEEFVGLIKSCRVTDLEAVAERMRLLVEKAYIAHRDEKLRVTISAGATCYRAPESLDELLKRADGLMYDSKRAGRNHLTMG